METVEVVVRLPKDIYECLSNKELQDWFIESKVRFYDLKIGKAIQNGTVLPKGHGRLCDIDAALKCMEEVADDKSNIKECAMGFFDWACSKRVVLEADKEASE